jgi:hypothetical protein
VANRQISSQGINHQVTESRDQQMAKRLTDYAACAG